MKLNTDEQRAVATWVDNPGQACEAGDHHAPSLLLLPSLWAEPQTKVLSSRGGKCRIHGHLCQKVEIHQGARGKIQCGSRVAHLQGQYQITAASRTEFCRAVGGEGEARRGGDAAAVSRFASSINNDIFHRPRRHWSSVTQDTKKLAVIKRSGQVRLLQHCYLGCCKRGEERERKETIHITLAFPALLLRPVCEHCCSPGDDAEVEFADVSVEWARLVRFELVEPTVTVA